MRQDPNQTVGQIEKKTQARVVALFLETLGYDYFGDWIDRKDNRNVEEDFLRTFLKDVQGYDDALINRALFEIGKVAGDQSSSLYDINRSVYELLRYGVKVKAEIGENTQNVWLIDWSLVQFAGLGPVAFIHKNEDVALRSEPRRQRAADLFNIALEIAVFSAGRQYAAGFPRTYGHVLATKRRIRSGRPVLCTPAG